MQASALLDRYAPVLRYDSLEGYFADSAEEWTLSPHNQLKRVDGNVVKAGHGLSLGLLGPRYADGTQASERDCIESVSDAYTSDYAALRASHEELRNVVYGRAVPTAEGTWLQYWFFYFLNDYQLAWGVDVHEGDWEMVQLLVPDGADVPEQACYAQHTFCEVRDWADVSRDGERPVVFVGRGSHASFFEPGFHQTDFYDITDGRQSAKNKQKMVDVTAAPAWLMWPGLWGGRRTGYAGPSSPSKHDQWDAPEALLASARTHQVARAPGSPQFAALRRDGALVIEFDASRCAAPLRRVVVTVNCIDEPTPPRPFRFALSDIVAGRLRTATALERHKHYEVRIAAVLAADKPGETAPTDAQIFLFAPTNALLAARRAVTGLFARFVHAFRTAAGTEYGTPSDELSAPATRASKAP